MLIPVRENIQVWVDCTRPVRMVWRGERWRVIDEPTLESRGLWAAWRTTVRSDQDHRTVVVDLECVGDDLWSLLAVYE